MDQYLIPLQTPCVYYDETFLAETEAEELYQDLWKNTAWEKTAKINRWVSLYHELGNVEEEEQDHTPDANSTDNADRDYKYRDAPGASVKGFTPSIRRIQQQAQDWYQHQTGRQVNFNVCLLNFYETGDQRIGWHSDREEIGRDTPIASVSLGATRTFLIRSKNDGVRDRASVTMTNGSMIVMENVCQHEYVHSVPKETSVETGRINLTFRCKQENQKGDVATTAGEEEHERRDQWLENLIDGAVPTAEPWSLKSETTQQASSSTTTTNAATAAMSIFGDGMARGAVPEGTQVHFLVKTNLGAEGYCAAEIREILLDAAPHDGESIPWTVVAQPLGMDGYVACCCDSAIHDDNDDPGEKQKQLFESTQRRLLQNVRSANHLLKYHTHFDLQDLVNDEFPEPKLVDGETLYQYFKQQLVDKKVIIDSIAPPPGDGDKSITFRTTCERIGGPHAFRGPDVEFEVGGAISEYYTNCKPKMEDYDVNVRTDVVGNLVIVGTQLNVMDLAKDRHFQKFRNVVTIKANLAYCMVRCAGIRPGMAVGDPFCGSGTLLLEALEVCQGKLNCIGLDVSRKTIAGAQENAKAEGYDSTTCNFVCSDARGLRRHFADNSLDAIVSNLPWGIKTGHNGGVSDLQTIYEIFLRAAWYCLKDGARVVMFVLRGLQLTRLVRKLSGRYRLLSVNVIRTTNNLPCLVVIEKLAVDEVREAVKGQLAHLNKYVSVSSELYEAIHMETINDD
mmetsp:Transcript_5192/g.10677  ORF Transcript_5192/g.10677 Transcript_5192/m.10677 type:complete len:734 (-) Transcript_5192:8-2209(-)